MQGASAKYWDVAPATRQWSFRQTASGPIVNTAPKMLSFLGMAFAFVLGCASLFLLSAFLYRGSFQFFAFSFSPVATLAWDAMLSSVFFLQHSGMVRRSFQQRLGRFIPDPFHGLVYTIASGSTLIVCLLLWQSAGEPLVRLSEVAGWALRAVFLLTFAGFGWGIASLGSIDTFGIKPVLALLKGTKPQSNPIVIKGPYRWVRHPLYFFAILLFWSCPVITADRLLFNVLWTTWVVLATKLEERDLVANFGDSYVRYQNDVPMILPWRLPAERTEAKAGKC